MRPTEPLPLYHSWPLASADQQFDLGMIDDRPSAATLPPMETAGIGRWHCDLPDDSVRWSPLVHDLFGIPRGASPTRRDALRLYDEASRAAMERLRSHALRHRRGFTLDIRIVPDAGAARWLRLIAAPVCDDDRVTAITGTKHDVSRLYR